VTGFGDLVVLDFDDMRAYEGWISSIGPLAVSAGIQSTAHGIHVFLLWRDARRTHLSVNNDFVLLNNPQARVGQIKGGSDYVVAWPSIHPRGSQYTWLEAHAPWEIGIPRIDSLKVIGIKPVRRVWHGYLAFLPRLLLQPRESIPLLGRWLKNKYGKLAGVFFRYY
jgi:hypothetical protein